MSDGYVSIHITPRREIERSPRKQQSPLVDAIPPEFCSWACPECDDHGYVASTGLEVAHDRGLTAVCERCYRHMGESDE